MNITFIWDSSDYTEIIPLSDIVSGMSSVSIALGSPCDYIIPLNESITIDEFNILENLVVRL